MFKSRYHTLNIQDSPIHYSGRSTKRNSLKAFHEEIHSLFQRKKSKGSKDKKQSQFRQFKELSALKSSVHELQSQIKAREKQHELEVKLSALMAQRTISRNQKKKNSISLPPLHHFPPYQYPPPMYPPQLPYQQSSSEEELPKKKMYRKRRQSKRKHHKYQMNRPKKILVNLMKKAFRVVGYIVILKNLTKKIREKRKIHFEKFWPDSFQKSITKLGKWFQSSCRQYLFLMLQKKDVQISITGEETKAVLEEKQLSIRKIIKILLENIHSMVNTNSFEQISKMNHIFCKHGALIQNGVLTEEQIELVCVSEIHGYLRLDKALQLSQVINFFLIKIITYNLLLQPWKYSPIDFNIKQKLLYKNLHFIASVFYQLACEVQEDFLSSTHSDTIQINNWKSLQDKFKIKCSPSLRYGDCERQEQEVISGLILEDKLYKIFPVKSWKKERQLLKDIVYKMHTKLRKVHWKFINQIYPYKLLDKFL